MRIDLSEFPVGPAIAVRDMERAREFYEGKLGLKPAESREKGVLTFRSGSSLVLVYESQFAGTSKATTVTRPVGDVEGLVRDLKSRGVSFEHYDMPGLEKDGDVYKRGSWRGAWFKDADGNIHHLVSR
jgi:catechol 2,3-dioxygenase-like lactoylglutathione lyase family enzyme